LGKKRSLQREEGTFLGKKEAMVAKGSCSERSQEVGKKNHTACLPFQPKVVKIGRRRTQGEDLAGKAESREITSFCKQSGTGSKEGLPR